MSYRGTRRAELLATRRCTRSTPVLVLRTERKSSVLPMSKLSTDFSVDFSCSVGFVWVGQWERIQCAVQVDRLSGLRRVCPPVAQIFFQKKKKKNNHATRKIQEPSEKERFLQGQATGELERVTRWGSFTVFCIAKLYEQGRALVRMPRL